jgi:hypothetical protein
MKSRTATSLAICLDAALQPAVFKNHNGTPGFSRAGRSTVSGCTCCRRSATPGSHLRPGVELNLARSSGFQDHGDGDAKQSACHWYRDERQLIQPGLGAFRKDDLQVENRCGQKTPEYEQHYQRFRKDEPGENGRHNPIESDCQSQPAEPTLAWPPAAQPPWRSAASRCHSNAWTTRSFSSADPQLSFTLRIGWIEDLRMLRADL